MTTDDLAERLAIAEATNETLLRAIYDLLQGRTDTTTILNSTGGPHE